jgi:hypothetical protein
MQRILNLQCTELFFLLKKYFPKLFLHKIFFFHLCLQKVTKFCSKKRKMEKHIFVQKQIWKIFFKKKKYFWIFCLKKWLTSAVKKQIRKKNKTKYFREKFEKKNILEFLPKKSIFGAPLWWKAIIKHFGYWLFFRKLGLSSIHFHIEDAHSSKKG